MPFGLLGQDQQRINSAIAALLASDSANIRYLESLNNTAIAAEVFNPGLKLLIVFSENQIQLKPWGTEDQPQLRIKGSALNLVKLLNTTVDSASKLRELGIEVSGDVGLLLEISQLANRIEIDWEYLLSEKLGETSAVLISRATRAAQSQAVRTGNDISKLIRKQLIEQSNLPIKPELEQARRQIRELGYRLDRLELAMKKQRGN
ncbi:MAG: SCP2 sterol-binding domain-containing protein [Pseudomonadales bacterium]